jgi:transcription-repair coupling factor (superfamily II helicase)
VPSVDRKAALLPSELFLHDRELSREISLHLLSLRDERRRAPLLYIGRSETEIRAIRHDLETLSPDTRIGVLPPWDCLPYERYSPSRAIMGVRVATLAALLGVGELPHIVLTTVGSIMQRVPPRATIRRYLELKPAQPFDTEDLTRRLRAFGYRLDERVDEPGEAALRGRVVDVFPPDLAEPVRIEHQDGIILSLRYYDPVSQLGIGEIDSLLIRPTSEWIEEPEAEPIERSPGLEHHLPELYPILETLFDYSDFQTVVLGPEAHEQMDAVAERTIDAYETRVSMRSKHDQARPLPPDRLYLDAEKLRPSLARLPTVSLVLDPSQAQHSPVPAFFRERRPFGKLADWVRKFLANDGRVVLVAPRSKDEERLRRALRDIPGAVETVSSWVEAKQSKPATIHILSGELDRGLIDLRNKIALVAMADILGSRATTLDPTSVSPAAAGTIEVDLRIGDLVVHLDHGTAILRGLEAVETDSAISEFIRLEFDDEEILLVPADEMGRIWRYGASPEKLRLDRLKSDSWEKRRKQIEAQIAETAAGLIAEVRARDSRRIEPIVPPRQPYERFAAGFPFPETPDQAAAIRDVLADLAASRPMNRLVCGDVGYGKTEIALRAAAAVALSGRQVAVLAPTTVLVRQHVRTFERRFRALGLGVGHLSRLVPATEVRTTRRRLKDGDLRIVIGTHALAGHNVHFADLGLVVIDEEQRFGAAQKERIRALGRTSHMLALTATPIPRTLQGALAGLIDLSIIATPPLRRQPIRTALIPFDEATVREALLRESRRGGQSFVVCPRIEDIFPLRNSLQRIVPDLDLVVAHGGMPAAEIDEAMVAFADGDGDVLLATNIIESGLDVPRANTMLVWRPDRFGLSQLHQLRGRVGRGNRQGVTFLLTDPAHPIRESTRKRLETLESLDRLGAGFSIAARDLDQRGAGDILGEEQAGHLKMIGTGLYQHLLRIAVAKARGEMIDESDPPHLNVGARGWLPDEYVPEPELRINLHAQLAGCTREEELETFREELADRFGLLPEPAERWVELARLRVLAHALGITRIDAGPQAVAVKFREDGDHRSRTRCAVETSGGRLLWREERLLFETPDGTEPLVAAQEMLHLLAQLGTRQKDC